MSLLGAVSLPSISCLENVTLDDVGVSFDWTSRPLDSASDAEADLDGKAIQAQNGRQSHSILVATIVMNSYALRRERMCTSSRRQLIIPENTLAANETYVLTLNASLTGNGAAAQQV